MSFSLSPIQVPSAKEFDGLPEAINNGAVAGALRSRGFNVQTAHIRELKVDSGLLETSGGTATIPPGATGTQTAQFTLRLVGPDATLGNGGLLRVLMRDGIATQLGSGAAAAGFFGGAADAVSVTNSRLVNVKLVRAPGGGGDAGGSAQGSRRRRTRRSLLLLEGAPPAGSPERAAAVAKASVERAADAQTTKEAAAAAASAAPEAAAAAADGAAPPPRPVVAMAGGAGTVSGPYRFDRDAASSPAIDVTVTITRLTPGSVRSVYADVSTLSETNQFTNLLKAAGYRIDSVRDAPVTGWFTVDGKPYGTRSSLTDRARVGDWRPLARAVVIPFIVTGVLAVLACALCCLLRSRQVQRDRNSGVYYKDAGCWPRFLGGRSLPRSTGLDAAVAAAVRKAGGPVSAAELLLRDIESGGKAAASAGSPGTGGGGGRGGSGCIHGAFATAAGAGGAGNGSGSDGAAAGGRSSGSGALAPTSRRSSSMEGAASASSAAFLADDDPYGRLARGWQLDPASLQILTKPDGSEWELGAGTSGRVFKALYNGVQEVAVKVFNDALPSLAALAEEEERERSASEEAAAGGGGGGGGFGGKRRSSASSGVAGGPRRPAAAGLKTVLKAAMAFSSSLGRGGSGKRSASGEAGAAAAAGHDGGAAAAVVSPPSSLATEAPTTESSYSMAAATKAAATDVTSAPAGGLATAQSKGAGLSSAALTKKPQSRQRAAAKQQLEDLAREVLLLRACHDRNVVAFVGASVQSGHAVLVTVRRFFFCSFEVLSWRERERERVRTNERARERERGKTHVFFPSFPELILLSSQLASPQNFPSK